MVIVVSWNCEPGQWVAVMQTEEFGGSRDLGFESESRGVAGEQDAIRRRAPHFLSQRR
jgi:hypothetical protein